jgi:pyrimidine operon attenuation protein / uracil phosphoribosyltransferase
VNLSGKKIFSQAQVRTAIDRLCRDIQKKIRAAEADLALVGIQRRGVPLAHRLSQGLQGLGLPLLPVGSLDITLYRDDMHEMSLHPVVHDTDISFDMNGKTVILTDDVLFTGRTIRCALDQLMDFGRPQRVFLAVLVDRGHRELPIAADFIGETLTTSSKDIVEVHLEELDGEDAVWVTSGKKSRAREVM